MHTCFILQYVYFNPLHVSSIICLSSGGWIVMMQHLVSSLWKQLSCLGLLENNLLHCASNAASLSKIIREPFGNPVHDLSELSILSNFYWFLIFHATELSACRQYRFAELPLDMIESQHKHFVSCVKEICPRGGAFGWGTALKACRLRVRFPMMSLEIFIGIILSAAL